MKLVCALLCLISLASCSKEAPHWSTLEVNDIATKAPGAASEVKMTEENTAIVQCVGYGKRCVPGSGRIYQLGLVKFVAVEFMSEEDAWFAARKLGQFYSRNWLFDDVRGEPSAETFVQKRFSARSPAKDEVAPPENQ